MNILLIFNSLLILIPRAFFGENKTALFVVLPILFAIDLYMIGYMGFKQKPINPTFEVELDDQPLHLFGIKLNVVQKEIHEKLLTEFQQNKLYLNSELNILDVVQVIGSNRTYISSIINQQYNQNFCAFVNSYRMEELKSILKTDSNIVNEALAERAGFGSVKSMQRTVTSTTGMTVGEWRKQIAEEELN